MFKRANKITSLLVAAASVATMVPAYAADVKKVDSQEGTVYNAVAYKDGTAYVDGEVNDNDATYYLKDGKYNELADVDSGSDVSAYGTKYAKIDDGKDYNVDLSTGKVIDENVDENDTDDAQTALRKKAKEVDRWGNNGNSLPKLEAIPGLKFGEIWYKTTGTTATDAYIVASGKNQDGFAVDGAVSNSLADIYTDKDGNYIDADYNMGKIKVETTNASATIENSVDTEELDSTGTTKAAAKVTNVVVLGQDKDYIYRYADLVVKVIGASNDTVKINNKNYTLVGDSVTIPVIQKISKAQDSSDKDEAKYAKTVYNYFISKDDSTNRAVPGGNDSNDQNNYALYANQSGAKAAVIGGKLVIYYVNNSSSNTGDNVFVQAATLKQKNGYYYTDVESKTTIKAEYNDKLDKAAMDTDVDGNIYVLDGGYVKKFDGTDDWTKIYKVDGSFNAISTYDKDNMVTL